MKQEVEQVLQESGVEKEKVADVIDHLCALAFLGVEVNENEYRFVEDQDPQEYNKFEVLSRRLETRRKFGARYMINRPFWAYLETQVGSGAHVGKPRKRKTSATDPDEPRLDL